MKEKLTICSSLEERQEWEQAIQIYRELLQEKPNNTELYQRLQYCLAMQDENQVIEIQEYHQAIHGNTDDPEVYFDIGNKLTKKGLINEAVGAYLKALDIKPNYAQAYGKLRHITLHLKDLELLVNAYHNIIEKHPHLVQAYINMAHALTQQGKNREATLYYQTATRQRLSKKYPDFVKQYWDRAAYKKPNFIIIGAEKCGTSSLHEYIIQHPSVIEPIEKEIHFFTHHFKKGLSWYEAHFPPITPGSGYITGEASTSYIGCHNDAPQRLFHLYPDVKLLAVLRDPVERAISHYNQLVRLGREGRSLEEVMTAEMEVLEGVEDIWSVHKQYWSVGKGCIWHSLYGYFIERWMSVFPENQFLILRSENLFEQPEKTMSQVFEFLELSDYKLPSYPKYNSGGSYKSAEELIRNRMHSFFQPFNQQVESLFT